MIKALKELGSLTGMQEIKKQAEQIIQLHRISKLRKNHGLKNQSQSLHMVFTGNPGTGKTTAARLVGKAFAAAGILKIPKGSDEIPFVEIHHADVTSKYVGDAEKTIVEKFKQARGGVVFIDEAYAFTPSKDSEKGSGEKVVAAMVQMLEDMRDEVLVIAAGYSQEMDHFLDSNPGLRSRFSSSVHFPDYSVPDMIQIAQSMLIDRDYYPNNQYLGVLSNRLWTDKDKKGFGNGRTVRNIIEESIRLHSVRVSQIPSPSKNDLTVLTNLDIKLPHQEVLSEKDMLYKALNQIQGRLLDLELKELITKNS
ncbi:AAA family ATPase [Cytobacillus purgationiresistens]|uniref:Stage V sporulation protein K n=1 Tax=Cytobacillus purgationiresistens TaxID=863449 RepID=A0ABU0AIQ9_9BACI|nr:AAA family ATPase [Cytobacillus purgationiresistens]MDQ0269960.1 stage V sporulation protein K [Cytobacillus purgationiresistens]